MAGIDVPAVSVAFIGLIYSLFNFQDDELKLEYVEPQISVSGRSFWKIEYRTFEKRKMYRPCDLEKLFCKLKTNLGNFYAFDITYNFYDRIYFFVHPSIKVNASHKLVTLSSRQLRNQRRADDFRRRMAKQEEERKLASKSEDDEKKLSHVIEDKLNQKKVVHCSGPVSIEKNQIKFVSGGILPGSSEKKLEMSPIQKLTEASVKSDAKLYALSRFSDSKLLNLARLYLGYLMATDPGVIANGESKLSAEVKFKTEGLPVGEKLKELYFMFMASRGYDKESTEVDLEGVGRFERTSRLIRIQMAREKTRKFYGLRGGNNFAPVVEDVYFNEHRSSNYIGQPVLELSDSSGQLNRFN